MVHDDPKFVEEAMAALKSARHDVAALRDPMEALTALKGTQHFDVLITRVRLVRGRVGRGPFCQ